MSSIGTKFVLAQRFVFDPNNNSLIDKLDNNELNRLGSNESRILLLFCERPNQVVTRDELHEFVWRTQGFQVDDSSLTQAISTLRKLLDDSTKSPKFVKTVPKRGYQFIASVERTIPLSSSADTAGYSTDVTEPESTEIQAIETEQPVVKTLSDDNSDNDNSDNVVAPTSYDVLEQQKKKARTNKIVLLISILMPALVYWFSKPIPPTYKLLDTINDVPVLTARSNINWEPLLPALNQCVSIYLETHSKNSRRDNRLYRL